MPPPASNHGIVPTDYVGKDQGDKPCDYPGSEAARQRKRLVYFHACALCGIWSYFAGDFCASDLVKLRRAVA